MIKKLKIAVFLIGCLLAGSATFANQPKQFKQHQPTFLKLSTLGISYICTVKVTYGNIQIILTAADCVVLVNSAYSQKMLSGLGNEESPYQDPLLSPGGSFSNNNN